MAAKLLKEALGDNPEQNRRDLAKLQAYKNKGMISDLDKDLATMAIMGCTKEMLRGWKGKWGSRIAPEGRVLRPEQWAPKNDGNFGEEKNQPSQSNQSSGSSVTPF